MKKFTRIIGAVFMMGLLTFVSSSCKKDQKNGEMTITVSMPSIENIGERAYIDTYGKFFWHENDFIRVYNLSDEANAVESTTAIYSKIGNSTTQTARFRGPSVGAKKAEGYRIFYPVNMVDTSSEEILWNENRQNFTIADHQEFYSYEIGGAHHYSMVDPAAMPMFTQVNKVTDNFTLHHLFGVATFNLCAHPDTTVVVDSVTLQDNEFNIAGEISAKLHRLAWDDSQGAEYNLNYVWDQYHGYTPEFIENVLNPMLNYLGWTAIGNTLSNSITMNCIFEHEDGELKGVTLGEIPVGSYFNFMLRPLALSEGFNLTIYVHDGEPIVLTQDDFEYGASPCDYTWAVKPGKRKIYIKSFPINFE